MIIVRLLGGLGNQMFQYAVGRHLALKNDTELKLDISGLGYDNGVSPKRVYSLGDLRIKENLATPGEVWWRKLGLFWSQYYKESALSYDDKVLRLTGNVYLDGYWPCERYFAAIGETIRSEFRPKRRLGKLTEDYRSMIGKAPSVSLSVRRGDFVTKKFHGTCSPDYYKRALAIILKRVKNPCLFIFSDDLPWAKKNLRYKYETRYLSQVGTDRSFEDVFLISFCRHNIIANSSFSWWGAWLNNNPEKIVVAPKRWFGDKTVDTSDLIPSGWIRV